MTLAEMRKNREEQAIFVLNQKPPSLGSSRIRKVSGWCRYFAYASTASGSLVKCVTIPSIQSASHPSDAGDRRVYASASAHSDKETSPIIKTLLWAQQFSRGLKALLSLRRNMWVFFLSYRKKHGLHTRSRNYGSCSELQLTLLLMGPVQVNNHTYTHLNQKT